MDPSVLVAFVVGQIPDATAVVGKIALADCNRDVDTRRIKRQLVGLVVYFVNAEADVGLLARSVLARGNSEFGWLIVEVVAVVLVACWMEEREFRRRVLP
jgi:uncharacterized membrane protein